MCTRIYQTLYKQVQEYENEDAGTFRTFRPDAERRQWRRARRGPRWHARQDDVPARRGCRHGVWNGNDLCGLVLKF